MHIDTIRQIAWLYAGSADPEKMTEMIVYEMDLKTRNCSRVIFMDGQKKLNSLSIEPNQIIPYENGILVCADNHGLLKIEAGNPIANLFVPSDPKYMIGAFTFEEDKTIFLRYYQALPNISFANEKGKWVKLPHILDSLEWIFVYYNEKDKSHWASFKYSVVHYDQNLQVTKIYNRDKGFTGTIFKMLADAEGNTWFVNILGQVGRLSSNSGSISILSETDGYFKKEVDWSVPITKDAQVAIYVGTGGERDFIGGMDPLIPERYSSNSTSHVYIDSLSINNRSFPLSIGANSLEKLILD